MKGLLQFDIQLKLMKDLVSATMGFELVLSPVLSLLWSFIYLTYFSN